MANTTINTNIRNLDGSTYSGKLYATLHQTITTGAGDGRRLFYPQRWEFEVYNGVAYTDDTHATKMNLPPTDTATTPSDVPISLAIVDDSGRQIRLGELVVPTLASGEADLADELLMEE